MVIPRAEPIGPDRVLDGRPGCPVDRAGGTIEPMAEPAPLPRPAPEARVAEDRVAEAVPMPRPLVRRLVLVAGLALYVAGTIGSNIAVAVIEDHPVTILALSSRNRNLLGSVPFIDPVSYSVVGFLRVLAAAVVLFLIGRWYGAKGIGWVEGQVGELPAVIRWIQKATDRAGWALVLLMPGSNIVCLMVGHRRMPVRTFLPLVMTGIVLKLAVLWAGGKLFEDQIRSFLDFVEQYQWYIVIALFALTFVQSAGRLRRSMPEVMAEIEHPGQGVGQDPAGAPVATSDEARYGAGMDGGPDTK